MCLHMCVCLTSRCVHFVGCGRGWCGEGLFLPVCLATWFIPSVLLCHFRVAYVHPYITILVDGAQKTQVTYNLLMFTFI